MKLRHYAGMCVLMSGFYANADQQTQQIQQTQPPQQTQQPTITQNSYANTSTADHTGRFGVGITLGEPTGASAKYWLTDALAVDGAAGWSTHDHSDFYLHSDLLWHKFDLISVPSGSLPVYFGVGGLVRFRNDDHDNQVGIRIPVGVSYMFENVPVDIFVEVGPAIDVAPDIRGEVTGGIGARFWF